MPALLHRAEATEDAPEGNSFSRHSTIYIAGLCVVGALLLGCGIWLTIRFMRKRSMSNREKNQGAAFLSVRGLVKEGEEEKELPEESVQAIQGKTFSRDQLTRSVVLPDKALTRPMKTNEDILEFHRQSGNFPRPFAPKSFMGEQPSRGSVLSFNRASFIRSSFISTNSTASRFSVMSSNSSVNSSPTTGTVRKVRQLFNPVLPDELLPKVGERLTVVQSFDDGWCLVGREGGISTAKSLFKSASAENNVELGVVPAWSFLKPVKGLRAERPVRSTSLGITVQMEASGFSSREEIISWSNF